MRTKPLLILVASLLLVAGVGDTARVAADAETVSHFATLEAVSFDGQGTVNPPVTDDATDFDVFSNKIESVDDLNEGRSAHGGAGQDTTVDFSDPLDSSVDATGGVLASWTDGETGDGANPSAAGTSEFEISFAITKNAMPFSLVGEIEAIGRCAGAGMHARQCHSAQRRDVRGRRSVRLRFRSLDIEEVGLLEEGTHTFTVVADATASNGNALGGSAEAFFNLSLNLSCAVEVESPNPDDDTDEDNITNGTKNSSARAPTARTRTATVFSTRGKSPRTSSAPGSISTMTMTSTRLETKCSGRTEVSARTTLNRNSDGRCGHRTANLWSARTPSTRTST